MLKHNLLLFFRNIKHSKKSFFITVIGLTTGLVCALFIYFWVYQEFTFDKFHKNDRQLFQIFHNFTMSGEIETWTNTPGVLAQSLVEEMPEVQYAIAVHDPTGLSVLPTLSVGEINTKAKCLYASKDFFNVFSFELVDGNPNTVLENIGSIVISENLAVKLFNTTKNLIGKTVKFEQSEVYMVSGVFKTVPDNSSMQFDFLLTYDQLKPIKSNSFFHWYNNNFQTYVVLKKSADIDAFNNKITALMEEKCKDDYSKLFAKRYSEKYLYGKYENGIQVGGRIEYVKLFILIAILIIVIACINFINLSTARAYERTKEIGMKKSLGADRKTLIFQHLGESVLISVFSFFMALVIVILLLPQYNQIIGKQTSMSFNPFHGLMFVGITLFTGILAGLYPAVYISGFNPLTILKGKMSSSKREFAIRKGLVAFQFVLSTVLIIFVITVSKQIEFIHNMDLGYNKENIVYFDWGASNNKNDAFINDLKNIPGILNVSSVGISPVNTSSSTVDLRWEGKKEDEEVNFDVKWINFDYFETLEIEMKEGRSFSKDYDIEKSGIIFNEAAINIMGLNDPIGKEVVFWGRKRVILGITENYHYESLHEEVNPLLFIMADEGVPLKIITKIHARAIKETIKRIKELYIHHNPGNIFEYKLLDEDIQMQYVAEKRVAVLSKFFAGIVILLSCLGLYGVTSFMFEKRFKEIGIRKSLGSTDLELLYILSIDITLIVIISLILSLPIGYFISKNWLNYFAFKTEIKLLYFILTAVCSLIIAWGTMIIQTYTALRISVADRLRISE